jgi:hypothetical protein
MEDAEHMLGYQLVMAPDRARRPAAVRA